MARQQRRVTYVRRGQQVMLRNESALRLKWAGITWSHERIVCSGESFKEFRQQNPDVEFVAVKR